jgi:hypothetical protein
MVLTIPILRLEEKRPRMGRSAGAASFFAAFGNIAAVRRLGFLVGVGGGGRREVRKDSCARGGEEMGDGRLKSESASGCCVGPLLQRVCRRRLSFFPSVVPR